MILEYVTCDLCGSTGSVVRYRKPDNWLWLHMYEFPVVGRTNCGLVFVNSRPTFNKMEKYYPCDDLNAFQKIITVTGSLLVRIVFSIRWESWIRRSGINVGVFGKNEND